MHSPHNRGDNTSKQMRHKKDIDTAVTALLPIYEDFNLRRALFWNLGLAQLPSPAPILGHNLPQDHPKAVDVDLQVPGHSGGRGIGLI